jgi:ABC-2 type transport system permease protein
MNRAGIAAIYRFEMARWLRTLGQSLATPVITTSLYFVVFGAAIGGRMQPIDGVPYGAFIVPGLVLLSVMTESVSNASFAIYLPKFAGTIGEILSAPMNAFELLAGYVGAAVTKSVIVGSLTLLVARAFVPFGVMHPGWMIVFLLLIALSFSMFGFIVGLIAQSFEQLQVVPLLVLSPLGFLGGSFYALSMLPEPWRSVAYLNPVAYLLSGFRWAFYETSDIGIAVSLGATLLFAGTCLMILIWVFRTGWRLKP